jgi:hypothetical protein
VSSGISPNHRVGTERVTIMAIRTHLGLLSTVLSASLLWLRARTTRRVGLTPLSSDWLLDLERKSIRGHY